VVAVICDAACHTLHAVPLEAVNLVEERLHDKSVCIPLIDIIVFQTFSLIPDDCVSISNPCFALHFQQLVKKYTMERLAEIYRVFCEKSSDTVNPSVYNRIPGKILRCFYDKDFR
jgi:sister-chromatid-cohesion protein PDS5